jgi:hypothetical protein
MDLVGAGLGIATDFIPVPGLKPAFAIIKFIWDNVQKVCLNTFVFGFGVYRYYDNRPRITESH